MVRAHRNGAPPYAEALGSEQGTLNWWSTQDSARACTEAVWLEQGKLNGRGTQDSTPTISIPLL